MTDNVTKLRDRPPANDVAAWLRQIANDYEAGTFGDRHFMIVVIPAKDEMHWPQVLGIGINPGQTMISEILTEAQAFMTINKVARVS